MTAPEPTEVLCVVCLHERDDERKPFMQTYGRVASPRDEWPMTEVDGRRVHNACASDLRYALTYPEKWEWRDGAYRWLSNGHPAPSDCVRMGVRLGLADGSRLAEHEATRAADSAAALEAYRRNWTPPTGEVLAEMRAEFGDGAEMIDVLSGKRFRL